MVTWRAHMMSVGASLVCACTSLAESARACFVCMHLSLNERECVKTAPPRPTRPPSLCQPVRSLSLSLTTAPVPAAARGLRHLAVAPNHDSERSARCIGLELCPLHKWDLIAEIRTLRHSQVSCRAKAFRARFQLAGHIFESHARAHARTLAPCKRTHAHTSMHACASDTGAARRVLVLEKTNATTLQKNECRASPCW